MPFDPNLPQENTLADAVQMRSQLNGLKDLIDAIQTITAAQVDAVNTVSPDDPASVSLSVSGGTLHFSFNLPQGLTGAQGNDGPPGADGPPGPPFASAVVDAVDTLPPGSNAQVGVIFDGSDVRFTFGIPQGYDGATGTTGQPGEVSQVDLNNALLNTLSQTSNNSDNVSTLDTPFTNDPPTTADLELLRQAYNDLVLALRR